MTKLQEEWRPVAGYEGAYEVSNTGRVRSLARLDSAGNRRQSRELAPATSNGYLYVNLSKDGKGTPHRIHVLVARAFIGERPPGLEVHHRDHDKQNNHVTNLEYVTPQVNSALGGKFHRNKFWNDTWPADKPPLAAYLAKLAEQT